MKSKIVNETHIEGLLFDSKLDKKVSGPDSKNPGTEFITGTINIATDNECLNVVPVHFTYVTAITAKGTSNATYKVLEEIVNGAPTVATNGAENALKLSVDSAIGLNEWFHDIKDTTPISIKRNEGGFVHIVNKIDENEKVRNTFSADIIITNVKEIAADLEKNSSAKVSVKGYIFDFRRSIMPVDFSVRSDKGMKYFLTLDVSEKHPTFTKVWGRQISQTVFHEITEESAFDEASVKSVPSSYKDFVIVGTSKIPYGWDDPDTITASEVSSAMADREVHLATIKKRQQDYQSTLSNKPMNILTGNNTTSEQYQF